MALAPDLSHCLVAVTRANQIWRLPLHVDGAVTKAGIFIHLHGGPGGPDGLAWDPDGNLLVAHTGVGTVWRFNGRAEPTLAITSCAGASTTNLYPGGPDGRDLFIIESETGSVLRARLESA
jgi:gluconolactonase